MNVTDRINRILFIMSYVSQNQGVTVEKLAEQVTLRPRELLKELDFILLIGKPPFQPDDYVDIYVDENRVFIEFDQMLNRPLRFTRPEAIALLMAIQLLDPEVDPQTVSSLKKKIRDTIEASLDPTQKNQDPIVFEKTSVPISEQFATLRSAVEDRQKVRLDYYSLTRNQKRKRTVRPYFLTKSLGYWYLTGHCELREDIRTFKFERILSVTKLEERFPAPEDLDVARYRKQFHRQSGENEAMIRFAPAVAPWILETWGKAAVPEPEGTVVLTLKCDTLEYPSRLILSYAPHAQPISPPQLIAKVREDGRTIQGMYETKPVG